MKIPVLKHSFILFISLLLGFLSVVQYRSMIHNTDLFQEQNPFREIRLVLEGNKLMKKTIISLQEQLQKLSSKEAIQQTALNNIQEADVFSGKNIEKQNPSLEILIEGNISLQNLIEITHIFWNAGVENIKLNGMSLNADNSGFDQSGGQILVGSTPLNTPYMFSLYGNSNLLTKILSPETGALRKFQMQGLKITLSQKS